MNHVWTEPKRHPDCSEPCVSELALDQLFCGNSPTTMLRLYETASAPVRLSGTLG